MSNVLIGIIGVILFIGLALAGALFLGPRFQESTINSKAAASVQAVSQTAHAATLYQTTSGASLANALDSATTLRDAGYLKSIPGNPVIAANVPFSIGTLGGIARDGDSTRASYVLMYLGQSSTARDICIAIERQLGHVERLDKTTMETTVDFFTHAGEGKAGCHRNSGSFGDNGGTVGDYLVFYSI